MDKPHWYRAATAIAALFVYEFPNTAIALEFQPCHAKTCAAVTEAQAKTAGALFGVGVIDLLAEEIMSVGSVPGCTGCASLRDKLGKTVCVVGRPCDVSCRVFGGDFCISGKKQ